MRTILLLLLAVEIHIPSAGACSCLGAPSPVGAASESGVAYVGEVVSVGFAGCGAPAQAPMKVRVVDPIAGVEVGETFRMSVHVSGESSCGITPPRAGDQWLFYGAEDHTIALCSADGPWDAETEAALREAFDED